MSTETQAPEWNPKGICNTCGRCGSYVVPWREGHLTHRCTVCVQNPETALLEAARLVVECGERRSDSDVRSAIRARLGMALTAFDGGG